MADTTVTIKKDGTGDYTTISSAVSASNVSSGFYKMVIDDSNSYNESVTLNAATGSETSSNYMWLTVSEGNRHSGVSATSGHARLYHTYLYPLYFDSYYARAEYLELDTTSSNNYYTVNMRTNYPLMSRCIVKNNGNGPGIFCGPEIINAAYIDNCLVTNGESGIRVNTPYLAGSSSTIHFDHCTIVANDNGTSSSHANITISNPYDTNLTTNFYNNALGLPSSTSTDIYVSSGRSNKIVHSGSHNAWDTDTTYFHSSTGSYTDSQDISSGGVTTTTTTANAMIVTSLTSGSENFTPVKATGAGSNLLLGNGTNRQGSEPDSRQDFSTDIRGAARPTTAGKIDIGAFQITTAAGFKYWDGSDWADSTAVQYYNGSAWTDVTGIQYWNGSAWTDPS